MWIVQGTTLHTTIAVLPMALGRGMGRWRGGDREGGEDGEGEDRWGGGGAAAALLVLVGAWCDHVDGADARVPLPQHMGPRRGPHRFCASPLEPTAAAGGVGGAAAALAGVCGLGVVGGGVHTGDLDAGAAGMGEELPSRAGEDTAVSVAALE